MIEADLALTTGASSVSLPSNFHRLSEVRLVVEDSPLLSREICVKPKTYLVKHFPAIEDENPGKPTYGYLQGTTLFLIPLSDADYTVRMTYYKLHPDLSADSSECEIRHAGECVAAWASYWVFHALEQTDSAAQWLTSYRMLLATAIKVDKDNSATNYEAIQRGSSPGPVREYWNDPFAKRMP